MVWNFKLNTFKSNALARMHYTFLYFQNNSTILIITIFYRENGVRRLYKVFLAPFI